jgi:hypothetical protein
VTALRGLLESAEWQGSQVLAGVSGSAHDVQDVTLVLDVADGARSDREYQPDRLVLLATRATPGDWRLDGVLRQVHRAGASGVVLPPGSVVGESARRIADALGVALVVAGRDPAELLRDTQVLLTRFELQAARLVVRTQAALGSGTFETPELLARAAELLGVPVALVSGQHDVLSSSKGFPDAVPSALELSTARRSVWHHAPSGRLTVAAPVRTVDGTGIDSWLVADVVYADAGRQYTTLSALDVAAGALQRSRAVTRLEMDRKYRGRISLLGDVLRTAGRPSPLVVDRVAAAGWVLDGWHTGFHFQLTDEDRTERDREEFLHVLADLLRTRTGPVAFAEHGEGIAGWVTEETQPTGADASRTAFSLRGHLRDLQRLGFPDAVLGVSRAAPEASGIVLAVGEATSAAALARGRTTTGGFVDVGRFGAAQLLLAWTGADSFRDAVRDLLKPLLDSPVLVRTLLAVLDGGGSMSEAAAALDVHRNTVSSRMARIESLLGVSLADPDTRLGLHLACRSLVRGGA